MNVKKRVKQSVLKRKIWLIGILIFFISSVTSFAQTGTLVTSVEAESGVLYGGLTKSTSIAGYSGTGYVTNFRNAPDSLSVVVTVPTTAFYSIFVRYNSGGNKYQKLDVNGTGAADVYFPQTSGWAKADAGKYFLHVGANSVTVENSWGWVDIDQFLVYTTALNTYNNITSELVDPKATTATKSLYNFLLSQFGKKIISGQTDSYYDDIKRITGQSPVYRAWDFQHYTEGYSYLWKNGGFSFGIDTGAKDSENAIAWYNSTGKKGIVGFQWHWHSPSGGNVGKNTFYTAETTFDIRKAVQVGTPEYALIIRDIDAIAAQLKKFQTANVPVLFRPLHEAGGGWFWWGAKGGTACKQLYAILYDRIMNFHQIHNLIWVWSTPETDWYPGNGMVDIVGHDSYPGDFNYGTQKNTFDRYYKLTNGEKLVTMSENGPIPDPDNCLDYDSPWSYFMSWSDLVLKQNSEAHLKAVFTNPRVLTLENDTIPMIISTSNASVCSSSTILLEASANFGAVNWFATPTGGTILHTGTSYTTPALTETTTFYVEASYNGHPSAIKRTAVTATVFSSAETSTISGISAVCQGTAGVVYSVPASVNVDSYAWTLPSGATGISATNSITVNFGSNAISGNVKIKGHNACGDGAESTFAILVNEIPVTPVISLNNIILQSDASTGNQWYFNNSLIPGAVNNTYTPTKSGNYYTIVTHDGCSSQSSNIISFIMTGVDDLVGKNVICIFPNPVEQGKPRITISGIVFTENPSVKIFDLNGKIVYSGFIIEQTIDLGKGIDAGIYVVNVITNDKIYIEKLIVK